MTFNIHFEVLFELFLFISSLSHLLLYLGNQLAYRFDFSSSSTDPEKHLAICTGLFEEYEVKELETVHDETGTGRDRVISSFVKMIRVEESQGKLRLSKLIEELMELENSQNPTWDSDIGIHL